jgi:hypothetical protein
VTAAGDARHARAIAWSLGCAARIAAWRTEESNLRALTEAPATRDELVAAVARARASNEAAECRLRSAREACERSCDELERSIGASIACHRRELEIAQVEAAWRLLVTFGIADPESTAAADLPGLVRQAREQAIVVRQAIADEAVALLPGSDDVRPLPGSHAREARQIDETWRRVERREAGAAPSRSPAGPRPTTGIRESLDAMSTRHLEYIVAHVLAPLASDARTEAEAGMVGADPLDEIRDMTRPAERE